MERAFIAIDLKSFYASVECVSRGRDPLTTNLVVADESRTEKTICLAVTPPLKAIGVSGRARLFEVISRVREVNAERKHSAPNRKFSGSSDDSEELKRDPSLGISYIVAPPRMRHYMEVSTQVYGIYLRFVSPEDIHVYSVDEVFIDATKYLSLYGLTARELTVKMIREVLKETGITATAGIGTNLYLAKVAMDIVAKHTEADRDGVRIAELDEFSYRRLLWSHRPITDFWRIGPGYARRLEDEGLYTMGDVARASLRSEDKLYSMFGVNAELLIDHAWGWEPCEIADIKNYRPEKNSMGSGQVLKEPYSFEKARLVCREMTDVLVLDLVERGLVTDRMVLTVCYDVGNLSADAGGYGGAVTSDRYGRLAPKEAHGTVPLPSFTSSTRIILDSVTALFEKIVRRDLSIRRINVVADNVVPESSLKADTGGVQIDMFVDRAAEEEKIEKKRAVEKKEKKKQNALIGIKKKYGKNAILRGFDYEEGATSRERNAQVGGHKA
ncbi:MAG: DNA methylase [Clostridia bacterium]|nr:DNA methylase [Clostridia bacterium]